MKPTNVVVGLGEVGKPLLEIIKERMDVVGVDIQPFEIKNPCEVMHICFPFQVPDFVGQCASYIEKYKPQLTVINSTIAPGTTRSVFQRTGRAIAYSPVRGKHVRMQQDMLHYVKFIGGIDANSGREAERHFQSIGMKTKLLSSPEAAEMAKLSETTYFGVLIAWAQEVERYCDELNLYYDEIASYYEEISYLPSVKFTPGVIGGHCVMPNIAILQSRFDSDFLNALEHSNELKKIREARKNK